MRELKSLSARQLQDLATEYEQAQRFQDLLLVLERLHELLPNSSRFTAKYLELLMRGGALSKVEVLARNFISQQKRTDPNILAILASCLMKRGQALAAVEALRAGLQNGGKDSKTEALLADALLESGSYDEGMSILEQVWKRHPDNKGVATKLARLRLARGEALAAATIAQSLVALGDRSVATLCLLGRCHAEAGDLASSYAAYLEAIAANFDHKQAHFQWLSDLTKSVGGLAPALEWMLNVGQTIGLNANDAHEFHLARLAFALGRLELANDALERLSQQKKSSMLVHDIRTRVLSAQGQWVDAFDGASRIWEHIARVNIARRAQNSAPPNSQNPQVGRKTLGTHKIVYSMVEIAGREFDSRLKVACRLAELGISTLIASSAILSIAAPDLPRGSFLLKTMNALDKTRAVQFSQLGHHIAALDEEALGWVGRDELILIGMDPEIAANVDMVLANNDNHAAALRRCYPAISEKVFVSGNPRLELLLKENLSGYEEEAALLKAKHGQIILICTNFCGLLSRHMDYLDVCDMTLKAANRSPLAEDGRVVVQMGVDAALAESKNIAAIREFIPEIARCFPNATVVVRPHPVEDAGPLRALYDAHPNIVVSQDGTLQAWLRASSVMAYFAGCMTGLEAFMCNTPAICFNPDVSLAFPSYGLSSQMNHQATSTSELTELLNRAFAGSLPSEGASVSAAVRSELETLTKLPSREIANHFHRYMITSGAGEMPSAAMDTIRNAVQIASAKLAGLSTSGNQLHEAKQLNLELAQVVERVEFFCRVEPDARSPVPTVTQLSPNAFLLTPS